MGCDLRGEDVHLRPGMHGVGRNRRRRFRRNRTGIVQIGGIRFAGSALRVTPYGLTPRAYGVRNPFNRHVENRYIV